MTTINNLRFQRGLYKAYREYLNIAHTGSLWSHNQFRQRSRGYGDYLYSQDRDMFDWQLAECIAGRSDEDFNWKHYLIEE